MYYAQIDAEGICFAVTQTWGEIIQDDMIEIEEFDESLLGMKRMGASWEPVPEPPREEDAV